MIKYPCAKINLGLNIVSKRPDGYHNLETVFYPIPLFDKLEVNAIPADETHGKPYLLETDGIKVEGDDDNNLVVKAYMTMRERYQLPCVHIKLIKNIPTGAGMGGGSSDCAFMIKALNEEFHLNLKTDEMEKIAATLGADCAFFIHAQAAFATGIGDILEPIDISLKGYQIVIVKPDIHVSTPEAFAHITPRTPQKSIKEIVMQPIETWRNELMNDFEKSVFANHQEIASIKETLYNEGAVYSVMSGSGSSVIGLFKKTDEQIKSKFAGMFCEVKTML
jgi:4-diphosphocytidyl-2-C-methyl-D-erythritol kinase